MFFVLIVWAPKSEIRNPVQNYFAVTILVNASKPRFKGSYSDVRRFPHRMHSISVRRGPRLSFDGAKVQYRTDTRSQSCQKNAKKCTFLWKWVGLWLFLNNDTANLCIYNEPVGGIKIAHIWYIQRVIDSIFWCLSMNRWLSCHARDHHATIYREQPNENRFRLKCNTTS